MKKRAGKINVHDKSTGINKIKHKIINNQNTPGYVKETHNSNFNSKAVSTIEEILMK